MSKTRKSLKKKRMIAVLLSVVMTFTMTGQVFAVPTMSREDAHPITGSDFKTGMDNSITELEDGTYVMTVGQRFGFGTPDISTSDKTVVAITGFFSKKAVAKKVGSAALTINGDTHEVDVIQPEMQENEISLNVGTSETIHLDNVPNGTYVSWVSEDPIIASVNDGTVYGHTAGATNVHAWINGSKYTTEVVVNSVGRVSASDIYMPVGGTANVDFLSRSAFDNSSCFTYENGIIKGTSAGSETINIDDTVVKLHAEDVSLVTDSNLTGDVTGGYSLELSSGDAYGLTFEYVRQDVNWTSSNPNSVIVNECGYVYARKAGTSTVSATVDGKDIEINVTVDGGSALPGTSTGSSVGVINVSGSSDGSNIQLMVANSLYNVGVLEDDMVNPADLPVDGEENIVAVFPYVDENRVIRTIDLLNVPLTRSLKNGEEMMIIRDPLDAVYHHVNLNAGEGTFRDGTQRKVITALDGYPSTYPIPQKEGYVFDKWTEGGQDFDDTTPITEDKSLVAVYRERTDDDPLLPGTNTHTGAYQVTLDPRSKNIEYIDGLGGYNAGDEVVLTIETTAGYAVNNVAAGSLSISALGNDKYKFVMPNGNVSILVQTMVEEHTITYDYNGAKDCESLNPTIYNVETERFTLNAPTRRGYIFRGWTGSNGSYVQREVVIDPSTMETLTDLEFKANWQPDGEAAYTVRAFYADLENNFSDNPTDMFEFYAPVGSNVTVDIDDVVGGYDRGFTVDEARKTATVEGDDSTVIDFFFTRNSYTVSASQNAIDNSFSIYGLDNYLYGQNVEITVTPNDGVVIDGLVADGDDVSIIAKDRNNYMFTMPSRDVVIDFGSSASKRTGDEVVVRFDWNFASIEKMISTDFSLKENSPGRSGRVKFPVSEVAYTYENGRDHPTNAFTKKLTAYTGSSYNDAILAADDTTYADFPDWPEFAVSDIVYGYYFLGWNTHQDGSGRTIKEFSTVEDRDYSGDTEESHPVIKLYAQWAKAPVITYQVRHWQQKVGRTANRTHYDPLHYELVDTVIYTGAENSVVNPTFKSYPGFEGKKRPSDDSDVVLSSDSPYYDEESDSLILNYYYDRNDYEVKVQTVGGKISSVSPAPTMSVEYGARVTVSATASDGYKIKDWLGFNHIIDKNVGSKESSVTFDMPNNGLTLIPETEGVSYTIKFDKGDAAVTGTVPASITATYGSNTKIPGCGTLKRTGYHFVGWKYEATGTVYGTSGTGNADWTGATITDNLTAKDGDTVTLVAQWEVSTYKLTIYNASPASLTQEYTGVTADADKAKKNYINTRANSATPKGVPNNNITYSIDGATAVAADGTTTTLTLRYGQSVTLKAKRYTGAASLGGTETYDYVDGLWEYCGADGKFPNEEGDTDGSQYDNDGVTTKGDHRRKQGYNTQFDNLVDATHYGNGAGWVSSVNTTSNAFGGTADEKTYSFKMPASDVTATISASCFVTTASIQQYDSYSLDSSYPSSYVSEWVYNIDGPGTKRYVTYRVYNVAAVTSAFNGRILSVVNKQTSQYLPGYNIDHQSNDNYIGAMICYDRNGTNIGELWNGIDVSSFIARTVKIKQEVYFRRYIPDGADGEYFGRNSSWRVSGAGWTEIL